MVTTMRIFFHLSNIYYRIRNTISKHHQYHKTVPLHLKIGKYYDPDVRIVCCLFEELKCFHENCNCVIPEKINHDFISALKYWKKNRKQILQNGSSYHFHPELKQHLNTIIKYLNFLWY